ncbi:uncharacterized protein LOC142228856, partial [Haematobia irritans]|uniref:uncharacterized protein LOC142228856 n=1 Tax=Haematobia irritans TaxID=7368 RepID=UPI003F50454C
MAETMNQGEVKEDLEKKLQEDVINANQQMMNVKTNNAKVDARNININLPELPKSLEVRKSRKDLKLPLLEMQQGIGAGGGGGGSIPKPPIPVKKFHMKTWRPSYLKANTGRLEVESNDSPLTKKPAMNVTSHLDQKPKRIHKNIDSSRDTNGNWENNQNSKSLPHLDVEHKIPRVLSKPQYACFLRQPETERPIQRSRSNEFRKTYVTNLETLPVFRSNSLKYLEKSPYSQENSNSVTTTFSMEKKSPYFNPDVNSTKKFISNRLEYANRKSSLTELDQKSISHSNLPKEKDNLANNECKDPENLNQYSSSTEPKKISYKNQDPNLLECSAISLPNLTQTSNYKTNITETKTNNNLMCRSLNDMKQESEAISLISSSLSTLNATQDINDQTGSPINTDFDYSQIQQVSCSLPDVNKCLQPIIDREESDIFLDFGEVEETYSTKSLPDLTQNLDQHSLKTYVNDDRKSISTEDISEKHLNLLERGNYSIDISRKQNSKDSSPICNMSVDSLDISEDDDIQHEINHRCDIINPNSDINNIKMGLSSEMLVSQYANNETEENAKDISTLENIKSSINDLSEVLTSENNSSKNTQRYEILKEVSDLENNKSVTNNISHKSVLVSPENGSSLDDIQYESNQKKNDFNLENKNSCFKNVTNDISNELSSDNSSCLDFKQNSFSINEDVYKTSTESEDKKMNQKIIQYSLCEQKDKKIVDRSSCDRVESRKSVYEENVLEKSIETSKECHPKQQEFISIPSKAEDKSNFHINLQNESSFIRKNQTSNLSLHSSENIPEEKLIENNFKSSDNQKPLKDQIGEDLANSSQKSNTLEKIKTCLFREQFSCENNMQTFNIIDKNFLESCKDSKNETIVRSSEIIDIDRKLKSYEVSKDEIIATSFEREDIAAHNPEKRIAKSYEDSQIATSLQNLNDSKLMSYEHTKDEIIARSLEIEDIAVHNPGKRIAKSYEVSQSKDKVIATSVQNLNDSKDVIVPISSETVDIAAHNTDRMRLKSYEDSKSKDKIIATEVHNLNDRKLKLYEDSKDEIIARSSEIEDIAARNPEKRIMKSYEDSKDVIVATSFENEDIAAHNFDKRRLRSYEDFRINDNHEKRILKSYEDSKDEIVATSFENEDIAAYNFDRRRLKSYENSQSKDKIITNAEHNINNRKLMSYEDEIIAASLETEDIAVHNSDRRRLKSYKDSQSNDKIIATSLAMKNIAIHNLDERSPIKIFNKSSSIFPEYKATINDDLNEKSLETNDNILNKHNISQDSLDRPLDSLNLSSDLNETETLDKEFSEQNQKHSLNLSAKIINNPLDSRSKDPIPSSINANLNEKNFETDDNILNKHNISQDIPDRCLDTIKLSSDLNETETLEKGPIEQNQNHSLNLNENTLLNKPLAWRNKDPIPSPSKPDQIIINDLSLITKESNKKFNDLSQNSKTTTSCILQDCSSPSKVLKIKTSNKFSIFSNSSTKDISQQSTYGVGRKCNRNVSKSFKNALTLYESFNEKQPKDSLIVKNKYITNVQRSISLLEKSFQKTRKEFEEVKANSKEFSNKSGNCNFSISPLKRNTNDIEYSKKSRENISESSSQKLGNDMENNNNRSSNYFNDLKQITHGSDNDSFITNLEFSKHYPEQTMNTNANNSHDYKNLVVEEKSIYLDKDTSSSSCLVKDNMNSFNESSNITSKLQSSTIQHHNNLKDMVHDTHTLAVKDFSSTTTLAINKNSKLLSTNNQILQVDGVSLTTSLTSSNIVKNEFSYSPNSRSFRFSKSSSNSITMTNNDNAR